MQRTLVLLAGAAVGLSAVTPASATTDPVPPDVDLTVTIENLAPQRATNQTPFWVGLHDGTFDIYDRGVAASSLPAPGSVALERLAEDGDTAPITDDFATLQPNGLDATVAGPNGPIAPGEVVTTTFRVNPASPNWRWFSYASMVLPSNDFFVADGNPQAHELFDEDGSLVATDFFVTGEQVLDAGTELNDEVPENTAFFGQQAPNTGVDEHGVVVGLEEGRTGFLPVGSGGILDDPRFANADFTAAGYPIAHISFDVSPVITDFRRYRARLRGNKEVPAVHTLARGFAVHRLVREGTVLRFEHSYTNLENVVGAHLHLGGSGENGPVVAALMDPAEPGGGPTDSLRGELTVDDLTGPLAGRTLSSLVAEIDAGNVYVNIHTDDGVEPANTGPGDLADGEIRGQLDRRS